MKHKYVKNWTEWAYSSANSYLKQKGRDQVLKEWKEYDINEMGKNWDEF